MKKLNLNSYKKIIGFGAGPTFSLSQKIKKLKIDYLIDNNKKFHNKKFNNLKVLNPNQVLEEKEIFIIIFTPRFYEIKIQLEKYKLKHKKNFIHFLEIKDYQNLIYKLTNEDCYTHLDNIINKGDTCIDIGANVGLYTHKLSKLVSSRGKVFGIEPIKIAYKQIIQLKKNYNLKNVKISNLAISDTKRMSFTKMVIPLENDLPQLGFSHLKEIEHKNAQMNFFNKSIRNSNNINKGIIEKVKIISLDEFVKKEKIKKINFIKIDVEGAESKVLNSAKKVLRKYKPIIQVELFFSKKESIKLIKYMKSMNYLFFYLKSKKIFEIKNISLKKDMNNYYFIHKENKILA